MMLSVMKLSHCKRLLSCESKSGARFWHLGLIDVSDEVRDARISGKPLVALESTIITHGMPYPDNLETALQVESIIRKKSVVPATVAVMRGRIKVGLSQNELQALSKKQGQCIKVSRRDFPFAISQRLDGGTTVSGTMLIAHKVGIPIFVTGGIGGVHRDGEKTMDVSADLTELGRTPVTVISSGIKSILDIGKTLEYLETQGVAVATYGPEAETFPAFYTTKSRFTVPYALKTPKEAAEFIRAIKNFELSSGALIGVPIPEEYSFDENEIDNAIRAGIDECKRRNISGKDVTPFLLQRISEITGGQSLKSNIALIKNNASVGADISVELFKLLKDAGENVNASLSDSAKCSGNGVGRKDDNFEVVVVGGSNLDFVINVRDPEIKVLPISTFSSKKSEGVAWLWPVHPAKHQGYSLRLINKNNNNKVKLNT